MLWFCKWRKYYKNVIISKKPFLKLIWQNMAASREASDTEASRDVARFSCINLKKIFLEIMTFFLLLPLHFEYYHHFKLQLLQQFLSLLTFAGGYCIGFLTGFQFLEVFQKWISKNTFSPDFYHFHMVTSANSWKCC